jgi:AcrR family transcriptional regulator
VAILKDPDPRRERTRRALIAEGRRIMAEKGVARATVLEIVREAGVSQPSFYNHFESRQELAEAVVTDFFNPMWRSRFESSLSWMTRLQPSRSTRGTRVAALVIRGAAFPLLQDILQGSAPETVETDFAELVLRMLGVPEKECSEIAARPEPF